MGVNYLEGGEWLDGAKLVAWLERYTAHAPRRYPGFRASWVESLRRRMSDWARRGRPVDFYALDPYLCKLGLYPTQIPDDVWLPREDWPRRPRDECRHGHKLTPDNLIWVNDYQVCHQCRRDSAQRYRAKQAVAA